MVGRIMRTEEVEINMTNWQELTIHVHRDAEEAVSNLMIETGSQLLHPV